MVVASSIACTGCEALTGFEDWLGVRDPQPILHASLPLVIDYGGPMLRSPTVVPIFFSGDPHQADVERFLSELSKSSYWKATTGEYGVGDLVVRPSIVVDEPIPASSFPDVEPWLVKHFDGSHVAWSVPNDSEIYTVFYPPEKDPATGQTTCTAPSYHFEGFLGTSTPGSDDGGTVHRSDAGAPHEMDAGRGRSFLYAVVVECTEPLPSEEVDAITEELSHELVETSTDPFVISNPAYSWLDQDHLAWSMFTNDFDGPGASGEVADLCYLEQGSDARYARLVGQFRVQRSWSNAAASQNQDPCVPATGDVYFNAAPDLVDDVTLYLTDQYEYGTKGVRVPLHGSRTVDVRLFSNRPRADWYVSAREVMLTSNSPATLDFQWDKPSGNNGDILHLTITRIAEGELRGSQFRIISSNRPDDLPSANGWLGFAGN